VRGQLQTRLVVAALGPKMCALAGEIADGVLLNWVTPEYARRSADIVREAASKAGRKPPKVFVYVRLAMGSAAAARLEDEADRYAAIPAYGANFERIGVKPAQTGVVADTPQAVATALARWRGAVDEVVIRAITGADTVDENLALVRAARPG
jgi:alkanesulfonate monooxygenase SsuD/methylene tetrahydromethanopterin reductase-like flavin-dependent oxidoreductase (luciferase family)